ncbi:4-hydroxybenzoate 3-monooxygenase [Pseudolysinimonas yzui]|uniref:4-hydroxybenzoate 3-monooxygenase n=1 Tax=Pseudolysinimonas yzui TaxID=2708254 RepID=A0A8J3M626_9MICO|nr:4-hydroxybenzoate 3-monooxygenase [Pseudolysinimonas yzui]GHF24488.1 4-hydroxybenzoate 3-monooxygenase [Pseudolysinimonas yzui]
MSPAVRTRVAIVGAGPAGLLLSHLLHRDGIESIVIDNRSREDIEKTVRAGIIENVAVDLLVETGASDRVLTDGHRHEGIELQFHGESHRIDFQKLVGRAVYLYPQHEVLIDLLARRIADGGDIRFEHEALEVLDGQTEAPRVVGKDAAGQPFEIVADVVIGADGSRSVARTAVVGSMTGGYFREYPFAWFGILCEAPPSSEELIYANSENGFALISQRSDTVQRMYLQCDPEQDPNEWSDAQIWDSLQSRVAGRDLKEGNIFQRDVLRFRSFVAHKLQKGRVFLVGDAAHTVPPTGAKGMNLAVNDVRILHEGLLDLFAGKGTAGIDSYEERALHRIWRAQHFSWWMTSMLHSTPEASDFDRRRQLGELESVVSSTAGSTYLAEAYTGWPYAD